MVSRIGEALSGAAIRVVSSFPAGRSDPIRQPKMPQSQVESCYRAAVALVKLSPLGRLWEDFGPFELDAGKIATSEIISESTRPSILLHSSSRHNLRAIDRGSIKLKHSLNNE